MQAQRRCLGFAFHGIDLPILRRTIEQSRSDIPNNDRKRRLNVMWERPSLFRMTSHPFAIKALGENLTDMISSDVKDLIECLYMNDMLCITSLWK